MIPPNLVKISQQTKKFIALQVGWWWGGGHQPFFLIYYNLALFLFLTAAFPAGKWVPGMQNSRSFSRNILEYFTQDVFSWNILGIFFQELIFLEYSWNFFPGIYIPGIFLEFFARKSAKNFFPGKFLEFFSRN